MRSTRGAWICSLTLVAVLGALVVPTLATGPGWHDAAQLSVASGNVVDAALVLDGTGHGVAAWEVHDGSGSKLYAARYDPAAGWGGVISLGPGSAPALAADAAGNTMLVYRETTSSTTSKVHVRTIDPTGTWHPGTILTETAHAETEPAVASNAEGTVVVAWEVNVDDLVVLWSVRGTSVGAWAAHQRISASDSLVEVGHTVVAMDTDGTSWAVWQERVPLLGLPGTEAPQIFASNSMASGWSTPTQLSDGSSWAAIEPTFSTDGAANAHAAWLRKTGTSDMEVWTRRHTPTGGWGTLQRADDASAEAKRPQLTQPPGGKAIVVWTSANGADSDVLAARWGSAAWHSATQLDDANAPASAQAVASDALGNTIVLFTLDDGNGQTLWSARYAVGDGWQAPKLVEPAADPVQAAEIGLDPDGNAVAWWSADDGIDHAVRSNRFISDLGPPVLDIEDVVALTNDPGLLIEGITRSTATVTVNNVPILVLTDGTFSTEHELVEGDNEIVVRSISIAGAITSRTLEVTLDTTAPPVSELVPPPGSTVDKAELLLKGRSEPNATVAINGAPVTLDSTGAFEHPLVLLEGTNNITIRTEDPLGNVGHTNLTITYGLGGDVTQDPLGDGTGGNDNGPTDQGNGDDGDTPPSPKWRNGPGGNGDGPVSAPADPTTEAGQDGTHAAGSDATADGEAVLDPERAAEERSRKLILAIVAGVLVGSLLIVGYAMMGRRL